MLLISARDDASQALNVLSLVEMRLLPITIEELMYAYRLARDWCEWIKNPRSTRENPVTGETDEHLLKMFEQYADKLGRQLEDIHPIEAYISALTPQLIHLWHSRNHAWKEDTRVLYRSLRYTAQMYEEKFGSTQLGKLLDEKQVPQMSELDKCPTFDGVEEIITL